MILQSKQILPAMSRCCLGVDCSFAPAPAKRWLTTDEQARMEERRLQAVQGLAQRNRIVADSRCAADRTPLSSVRCPDVASAWTAALLQLLRNCRSARMGPSATAKTRCPSASQQPARPSRLEFAGTSLARAHVEISWHYCTAALCRRCISRSSPTRGRHFDCHY